MELGFRFLSFPTRFIADYYLACSREAGVDRFGKRVVSGGRFAVLNNGIDIEVGTVNSFAQIQLAVSTTVL